MTSFNLIGAEDNILLTARPGAEGSTDFYAYTKDIRESTVNIVGADGSSQATYSYDDYGETTVHQKDPEKPFYNEICYTAGVYDETTGLYNLRAGYYDPADGSFLTQDTYRGSRSRTETLNLYTYGAGNPIKYTDPSGHAIWGVVGAAMGAYDGYKYAKKKNLKGWKKGAAILGGAVLGVVNPFKVVKAARTGYKAYKASKYTKKAVSTVKKAKTVKKVATKPKKTVVMKKTVKTTSKPNVVKKTTQTVKKQAKKVTSSAKPVLQIKAPNLSENFDVQRRVLNSFKEGKATVQTFESGTKLYRVGGKKGNYWSPDPPPETEYQWRVKYAIKQDFGNDASSLYTITIPEGASISGWTGIVGSQGMGLYGGGRQVYIDCLKVPDSWITKTKMIWR